MNLQELTAEVVKDLSRQRGELHRELRDLDPNNGTYFTRIADLRLDIQNLDARIDALLNNMNPIPVNEIVVKDEEVIAGRKIQKK